jgi:hypothetical protein
MLGVLLGNASGVLELDDHIMARTIHSVGAIRELDYVWFAHEGTLLEMHDTRKSYNRATYKWDYCGWG